MKLVSEMASSLVGSEILRIAGEINQLKAGGKDITNFTVGDFDPNFFPIPEELKVAIGDALRANHTNYPPSSGIASLRETVAEFYTSSFGIPTRASEVLIAGGARPLIYSIFTTLLDPNDTVVYPVPSWNNNHYTHLARCRGVIVETKPENGFMPTAAELAPHLRDARLLCLNSPLNPCGTVFREKDLREICDLVVEENSRPGRSGRPLFLMYDQIYWKLTHGDAKHLNPVALCPAIRPYTVFVDGLSKYFCGTGLRVGWSVIPETMIAQFSSVLGHVGAWAPKPEQVATNVFLKDTRATDAFIAEAGLRLQKRLEPLYDGLARFKKQGLPVDAIRPEGGIYLSMKIEPKGRTNEQIRVQLLQEAGIAVIPFQSFGLKPDSGWFRLSVGAVSEADIANALTKLENFLKR
jgi:aspartate aminotransferase